MAINIADARHVADLARLDLTEQELATYTEQLNQILDYAQELEQVNTDKVEPTYHSVAAGTALREDKAVDFPNQAGILRNGPEVSGTSFVVPRIL
ncbi:aspartyl/glutamyl-tRNA amidotransferase subunit C [Candidatus Termititenax persephonae]|uniref:Aspartyl/glutamyl-tRNA(Asn/Gln) amidotransferase subunit C n=1 Tax=Candidatus Termititenax persephonae TaxID=2218525 RepID=A0A388TFV3_9BACT|nr:aspartyl/glutamyl-tRNA amidotransferase subunit C [Candidatus Termititenax persephonae]